jgi:hypothetical protein
MITAGARKHAAEPPHIPGPGPPQTGSRALSGGYSTEPSPFLVQVWRRGGVGGAMMVLG